MNRHGWIGAGVFAASALAAVFAVTLLGAGSAAAQAPFVCEEFGGGDGGATATGDYSFACGAGATANGNLTTAVGFGANAVGNGSTAFGANAGLDTTDTNNTANTAIGHLAGYNVAGSNNTATGYGAGGAVIGFSNSAFGTGAGSSVHGSFNTAIGMNSGNNVGDIYSDVEAHRNVAIGYEAGRNINASDTVAIGTGANASADGAAAFGAGAVATRVGQQAFGTASNTYTFAGIASQASRDAQMGPTYFVTSDGNGNLATTGFDIGGIQTQLGELGDGVAMAMALGGAILPAGKSFAITSNIGHFNGSNALGVAAIGKITDSVYLNAGGALGFSTNSYGGRAGVTVAW